MEIDNSSGESQARLMAKRKRDSEIEDQKLQMDLAAAARARKKTGEVAREKSDKELVEISDAATQQMDSMKKLNSMRVRDLTDNSQRHYEDLAVVTAAEIKRNDEQAFQAVQERKGAAMEKIKNVTDLSQDPFYQLRSLGPVLSEAEKHYSITLNLPEHEAKNLFVSGEGQYVKIALARRFQDDLKNRETHVTTKTNSFQSVTEQLAIPGGFDARKISREFKDGVVTITIPKTSFEPKVGKGEKA